MKIFTFLIFIFITHQIKGDLKEFNGTGYHIFNVKRDAGHQARHHVLFAPPEHWIASFSDTLKSLDSLVESKDTHNANIPIRAQDIYLNMLMGVVLGTAFGKSERAVGPSLRSKPRFTDYDENIRKRGQDWAYLGLTMVGEERLIAIKTLLLDVFRNKVEGNYMETGVWRGGASIFARGVIKANHESHRLSFVCDSFAGLPPGDFGLDLKDKGYDATPYLEVSEKDVVANFQRMGVLDQHVWFVKGFFNNTMPPLAPYVPKLAVLRLDGDMYESTVDVLYYMYQKVEVGGYVIVDDWIDGNGIDFPAKTACTDFFLVHKLTPKIIPIDKISVYWQVSSPLEKVEFWRYEQKKFKPH